jgi:SPP1 family predicted phage head-tail adaptor
MRVGELDRRITLLSRGIHKDALGSKTMIFTELGKFWAKINFEKTGSEAGEDGKIMGTYQAVNFTVRYNTRIEAGDRVEYKGELYSIENILEIGRRSFIQLLCKTVNK